MSEFEFDGCRVGQIARSVAGKEWLSDQLKLAWVDAETKAAIRVHLESTR